MAKIAKVLIMLVRVIALVSIILGIMIWTGQMPNLLGAHIGLGFLITAIVTILAIIALAKRAFTMGALGLVAAVALPWIGFRQFPLSFMHIGATQVAHILVVIATLGLAESLAAAIRKAS